MAYFQQILPMHTYSLLMKVHRSAPSPWPVSWPSSPTPRPCEVARQHRAPSTAPEDSCSTMLIIRIGDSGNVLHFRSGMNAMRDTFLLVQGATQDFAVDTGIEFVHGGWVEFATCRASLLAFFPPTRQAALEQLYTCFSHLWLDNREFSYRYLTSVQ